MALRILITIRIMKKTLFSLGAFLFSTALIAQNKVEGHILKVEKETVQAPVAKSTAAGAESKWIGWGSTLLDNPENFEIDANPSTFVMTLMPDSLTQIHYSDDSFGHVWTHSAGNIVDLSVDPSEDIYEWLDDDNSFTVDSVRIAYFYERNLESSVVDTLRIQILNHSNVVNSLITIIDGDTISVEGSDFQVVNYTYVDDNTFNGVTASQVVQTILIPLTEADSVSNFAAWMMAPVDFDVAAGDRFGVFVDFIPGYSYSHGDSLENLNSFRILSMEETAGATPIYANTFNKSYFLRSSIRYDESEGWNDFYQPTMSYTEGFIWEHHIFDYKISSPNVGTVELAGISFDVNPNPSNGYVTISSTEELNNVNLNIINLIGQSVMNTTINGMITSLDLTELRKGIYLMNFEMEGKTITKKIVLK